MNRSRSMASLLILVLPIFLLVGLVWASYRFSSFNKAGEGYLIQWISFRALAKSGMDPYSDEATAHIRATVPAENSFTKDIYPKYTSPLYSGVLVFPFILIGDETLAQALWMAVQLILIFAFVLFSLRLTSWKPALVTFLITSLLTIFSFHVSLAWLDGGLSIWAGFFLLLSLVAINSNRLEIGGIFLAAATVQPQMVILPLIFILIWTVFKRKAVLILWFFITVVLLSVLGLFLVPEWVLQYIRILYKFSENFPPGTPGLFVSNAAPGLGKQLGWLISGIAVIVLAIEWLVALRKDFRWFLWTICLTMVISQWIGIPTIPANFVMLVIPTVLIFAMLAERWPRGGAWGAVLIALLIFIWEWAVFYLDLTGSPPMILLNLIFPLPLVLLIGLYWVRWWAVKPQRMLIEELRLGEIY